MNTASPSRLVPIGEIVLALADDIEALAHELLPGGRREGAEWVVPGAASPWGCSIGVHLRPPKAGVWKAWGAGKGGDALDLVLQFAALARYRRDSDKGDKSAAIRWARAWLGHDTQPLASAAERQALAANAAERRRRQSAARAAEERAKRASAWRGFNEADEDIRGTAAEAYLLGRGIDLRHLGRSPAAVRFHPRLWCERMGRPYPALVAAITRYGPGANGAWQGKFAALHRTWLEVRPDGSVGKAAIVDPDGRPEAKKTLGPVKHGLIALWRGASGKPLLAAAQGEAIILSEGIEDGLSLALAKPELRVAAAVSIGNLTALRLPPAIATVLIAAQNDPWFSDQAERGRGGPHPTRAALDAAVRWFQGEGRLVKLIRVPHGKDANDLLRGAA